MSPEPVPSVRGSSSGQDAAPTRAETADHHRPPRSILKTLRVEPVAPAAIRSLIEKEHYLHSMPPAPRMCFAVSLDGDLAGAVVFTSGSRHCHRLLAGAQPHDVATLARMWLADDLPRNSESRVIGVVLRHLKRETDWKLLLSYADPGARHVGTIYQASGWLYLGRGEPTSYVRLPDGALRHPRSIYDQYGTNRVSHLRATGVDAERVAVLGKYRYAFMLDPSWRWRIAAPILAYPRTGGRGPPKRAAAPSDGEPDMRPGGEFTPRRRFPSHRLKGEHP